MIATELNADPRRKVTIATTTQNEVQRIATKKYELKRLKADPKRFTAHVRRPLWFIVATR